MVERIDKRVELKKSLVIDEDDLDSCLIEQPQRYFDVADAVAVAIADRDAAKLTLEEVIANHDLKLRAEAIQLERKITEALLQRELTLITEVQTAQDEFANKRAEADRWIALKEAFQQRSFMLRELVASKIAQMQNLSIERGAHGAQRSLTDAKSDTNRAATSRIRAERRKNQ